MSDFDIIRQRAEQRKGGADALKAMLPAMPDNEALRALPDDRILSQMTRRIFYSGFVHKVIDNKWPGFEEAFDGFDPAALNIAPDEYWHDLTVDDRIVKNGGKIMSVRAGAFFADWPCEDHIGLLEILNKRGNRLGGATGQYFLRGIGRDGFIMTTDVLACLRDAGVPLSASGTGKKDQQLIQQTFNRWAQETGLPFVYLSRICGLSIDAPKE